MANVRTEHRVVFYSPGTFVSEESEKPISGWDTKEAAKLAKGIVERHGAKPFGFRFLTLIVADDIPDGEGGTLEVLPREKTRSGVYHLGGELLTYDDVKRRNDPKQSTLRDNMRRNSPICVVNRNSYLSHQPFNEDDVLLNQDGKEVARGDSPLRVEYRARVRAEYEAELEAWAKAHEEKRAAPAK